MVVPPFIGPFFQSFFLPAPRLTEKNIGSLSGKVVLVTGGNSGVGFELCQICYGAGAKVFLAGRNESACNDALAKIKQQHPQSTGSVEVLRLNLSDLASVSATVKDFLLKTDRLDYLALNAGVMGPPAGSKGEQGHELQQATNCLGHYILAELLRPLLVQTAKAEKAAGRDNVVRVSWAGSLAIDTNMQKDGMSFDKTADGLDELHITGKPMTDYGTSKTGNLYLATAWGNEVKNDGVVSVCFNPGNLESGLQRHQKTLVPAWLYNGVLRKLLHPQIFGAYTELWCGFSPDLTTADNGKYVGPWGRVLPVRADIEAARTGEVCTRYMDWVRRETRPHLTPVSS